MRCKLAAKPGKIECSIDLPHQMIFANRAAKMKLVEQLTLVTIQTARSWIDLVAIRVNATESRLVPSLNRLLQQNRAKADVPSEHGDVCCLGATGHDTAAKAAIDRIHPAPTVCSSLARI